MTALAELSAHVKDWCGALWVVNSAIALNAASISLSSKENTEVIDFVKFLQSFVRTTRDHFQRAPTVSKDNAGRGASGYPSTRLPAASPRVPLTATNPSAPVFHVSLSSVSASLVL